MPVSLVHALRDNAQRQPQAEAVVHGEHRVSYGELWTQAQQIAAYFKSRELKQGDRVALLLENSPEYVAAYYGVLAAGGVVVALNTQAKGRDLANWIEHAGAAWLIAGSRHPELSAVFEAMDKPPHWIMVGEAARPITPAPEEVWDELTAAWQVDVGPTIDIEPNANAVIIYTSGTTGRPKGVTLSHGNLSANVSAIVAYLGLTAEDSIVNVLPFYYSYGNSVLHTHIWAGARLILENSLMYPKKVLQRIADEKATGFSGVPSTYYLLLSRTRLEEFPLGSLRYLTQAGGAMTPTAISRMREVLPHADFYVMYGQTEATARLTYLPPEHLDAKLGAVGVAVSGTEISIMDKHGNVLPAGETGEICARGPHVMVGYWQDLDATAEVLRNGWLCTGDLGRMDDDGFITIEGRASDMIKTGAHRVSPNEIEEALGELDGVAEAAAVGVPDEVMGQVIRVVIVPKPDSALTPRDVQAHCKQRLATYKIPKQVIFADELPRTASGKIQRFKLVELEP